MVQNIYKKGLIIGMIILSLFASSFSVQATTLRTVYGKVYIDGELVTDGTTVKLTFIGQEITNDTYNNGNYVMNFMENNWETGTFLVFYNGAWRATTPPTVDLGDEDELHYPVDLDIIITANSPPNAPTLVSPSDSSTVGGTTSASLKVSVSDPNGDSMEVKFYNANGDVLIGTQSGISSGATTSKTWSGLSAGTTYSWYATAYDGEYTTSSATWSFTTGSGGPPPPPPPPGGGIPPVANFTYQPTNPKITEKIEFSNTSTDSDGNIVNLWWNFGDGYYSDLQNPIHIYYTSGTYEISLTVTDDNGTIDTIIVSILVISPSEEIESLINDIVEMNLSQGLENSFTQKLMNALQSIGNGWIDDAITQLNAFINQVDAQSGNKLTDVQADFLVAEAQAIIDSL